MPLFESPSHAPATISLGPASQGPTTSCCPCPWQPPPPYDLGFRVSPAYEGACAGHDLAGSCELGPYNILLPLPTAASAKHWGELPPYDLGFRVCLHMQV